MTSWIVVLASTLLATGIEGPPQGRHMRGNFDISKYIDRVAETVDASEEQVAQLEAIAAEHKTSADAGREAMSALTDEQKSELKDLHDQVREARRAGDTDKVESLQAQIHDTMGWDPRELMESTHDKIVAVLTPEQVTKFEAMAKERKPGEGFGRGKGKGQGHGRGFGDGEGFGRGDRRGPRDGGAWINRFVERVIDEVDATEEQQTQLKTIATEQTAALSAAREAKQAECKESGNRDEMRELMHDLRDAREDGDAEEVAKIQEQIKALRGTPAGEQVAQATFDKIASVLTEEQMPAYETLVAQAKERMSKARQNFDGGTRRGKFQSEGRRGKRSKS